MHNSSSEISKKKYVRKEAKCHRTQVVFEKQFYIGRYVTELSL